MSTTVRNVLTFLVVALNTAVVTVPDIPGWIAGIIVALVTGAAAIGIPARVDSERTPR